MSLRLKKKHMVILSVSFLLAAAMYFGAYLLYLTPLKTSVELKESQLKSEQEISDALSVRVASEEDGAFISTAEMQKILPVDPMVEQLLLDLEKAEVISGSFIASMDFGYGSEDGMADPEKTQADDQVQGIDAAADAENQKSDLKMPEGLSKTEVTISVEANDYSGIEKFIETLEKLQRFILVESIAFSGPEELESIPLVNEEQPIEMTLVINSFYMSGMDDLKEYNPKIDTPDPANKRNPFPVSSGFSQDGLAEDNLSEATMAEDMDDD